MMDHSKYSVALGGKNDARSRIEITHRVHVAAAIRSLKLCVRQILREERSVVGTNGDWTKFRSRVERETCKYDAREGQTGKPPDQYLAGMAL
ncbi:hypothetical protein WAI453_002829 [Rhynchosporium graminicola]